MRRLLGILLALAMLLAAAWSVASLLAAGTQPAAGSAAQQFHRPWKRLNLALLLNPANAFYWNQRAELARTSGSALSPRQRDSLVKFNRRQAAALAPAWEVPWFNMAKQCAVRQSRLPPEEAEACRALYLAALQRNPTYGYAHYRYADFLYDQAAGTSPAQPGQIEGVCRQYGQSLHLMRPTLRYQPWYRQAEERAYGRCLGLAESYAQARLLEPETGRQWQLMGLGLGKNPGPGGWDSASKPLFQDLRRQAAGLDQYRALARGLEMAKQPFHDRVFREYLALHPADPQAWRELVTSMLNQKKIFSGPQVAAVIDQARRQAVFSPDQMLFLASAARISGKKETAFSILKQALAADPASPKAFVVLGECLMADGRPKEAIKAYERAVALSPNFPDYHVYLGLAYARDKQYEAAVRQIQRALDLNPQDKKAKAALKKMGVY